MDFFNSLWEDPGQTQTPSATNFAEDITTEKWINHSSTYKLISGAFKHPHEWLGVASFFKEGAKKTSNVSTDHLTSTGKRLNAPKKRKKLQAENSNSTVGEKDEASDDDIDSEDESSFHHSRQYVPGLRKNPCNEKLSCMDNNEHAECLALFLKFSNFKSGIIMPSDRSEHFKFEVMYKKVQEEQAAFSQDALNNWHETAKDTQNVSEALLRPLQTIWMLKAKKALEFYPHTYKRRLMVPLLPVNVKVEMVKMSDLLQMGRIPAFFHPPLVHKTKAHTMISKMLQTTQYNLRPEEVVGSLHKLPVSLDPNAESLARLHKAQVVISSGALNALLGTYFDFSKSWTLPMSVKEYRTIEKGKTTTKTIVFIDKPLPKQSMTANECHRFLFKHGVKARLVQRKHRLCFTFPIPGVDPLGKEFSTTHNGSPLDGDVEDSGKESAESAPEKNKNNVTTEKMDVSFGAGATDDSEEEKLVIEEDPLPPLQTSDAKLISKNENSQSQPMSSNSVASTASSTVIRAQSRRKPFRRKDGLSLPKTPDGFIAPLSQNNVTYSSWVIRPENDDQFSVHQKKALKELSVIIRCQVDACQRIDGDVAALSLSPKVEYQIKFAAEEPTKDELLREWASLSFKPASHVLRTRVDVMDGEIVMCEKKDKLQITADAQRMHGIRLSDSLQTLYSVFSEVSSLTKGSYLLHHSPEENAFASLEESVEDAHEKSNSVRNLESYFSQKVSVSFNPNPPWRKLDCTLVLPRHNILKTMPATYRPKPRGIAFRSRHIPSKPKPVVLPRKKKKKKPKKNRNKKKSDKNRNNEE